jgi:hypothetical protein
MKKQVVQIANRTIIPHSMRMRLTSIVCSTIIVMLLNIGGVMVLPSKWVHAITTQYRWLSLVAGLFFGSILPLSVILTVILCMTAPFNIRVSWQKRVSLIIVGYSGMILSYSGVYFCLKAIGDYNQAASTNITFESIPAFSEISAWKQFSREDVIRKIDEENRSFKGMGSSLFLAIHEDPINLIGADRRFLTGQEIIQLAHNHEEQRPRMDRDAALGVWIDCLHFSIVTAATVGYGDIVPVSSFTKLITDSQILASMAIIVFGFTFVMSERFKDDNI